MDADAMVAAWLEAKTARSGSARTAQAYRATMAGFRARLTAGGLALDAATVDVAAAAAAYAGSSARARPITPATFNQRLAILSSFYEFAHRRQLLTCANPISLVERRPVQEYARAKALSYGDVRARLSAIDRSQPSGLRDYALLALLLQTGRRSAEVAALQLADVAGDVVTFRRCKGGKTMTDRLPAPVAAAISAWIAARESILQGNTNSLWVSLASNGTRGHQLTHSAIAAICKQHLGTSRVHATRHTFARAMEDAGAKVSDIQARLGHSSLATTGRYLSALSRAENSHASAVGSLLGLE